MTNREIAKKLVKFTCVMKFRDYSNASIEANVDRAIDLILEGKNPLEVADIICEIPEWFSYEKEQENLRPSQQRHRVRARCPF